MGEEKGGGYSNVQGARIQGLVSRAVVTERDELLDEIWSVLDNEIISHEDFLVDLLLAMETPEIRENWKYIKRNRELDNLWGVDEGGESG